MNPETATATSALAAAAAPPNSRYTLHRTAAEAAGEELAADVRAGLGAARRSLPPKYFYDELGSHLFEAICCLPEYYPTRAEAEILAHEAGSIAAEIGGPVRLVELGSGSASKTRHLLRAFLDRQAVLEYVPIDVSASALERSAIDLLQRYARLTITACEAGFEAGLRLVAERLPAPPGTRTLVVFLGSTIGNFEPPAAAELLRAVRAALAPGDGLLLGADLKKEPAVLEAAYDDPLGVTAAFNLNLLARLNRELGAGFDLRQFAHRAVYDPALGRVEMHLVSRVAQRVPLAALGLELDFAAGESIHTESSYKFDRARVTELAQQSGFELTRTWLDGAERFSSNLLLAR